MKIHTLVFFVIMLTKTTPNKVKKFMHEFQSRGWFRSEFHRMLRQLKQEGSALSFIPYDHNAALRVTHNN